MFTGGTVLEEVNGLLTVLQLAALLAVTPAGAGLQSPAPAATAPSPLKEIGRVRATTTFCRSVLQDTLAGISVVLDNDVRLGDAASAMRQVYYDGNPVATNNRLRTLLGDYVAVRDETLNGRRSIQQLKSQAEHATSDAQKAALMSLANALDGALARQKLLGDVVGRFTLYADSHQPIEDEKLARMLIDPSRPGQELTFPRSAIGPVSAAPSQLWTNPKHDIDEIEQSAHLLNGDEQTAADRIDPAFSGC